MSSEIDTHGMRVNFGKHAGELYTRIPVSYLRWMVNSNHSRKDIAMAELERRGIDPADRNVEISGHAIDSASLRLRKLWHETKKHDQEGLHAWLVRICEAALSNNDIDEDGYIYYCGLKLVFETGVHYPVLKTVMRKKKGARHAEDLQASV